MTCACMNKISWLTFVHHTGDTDSEPLSPIGDHVNAGVDLILYDLLGGLLDHLQFHVLEDIGSGLGIKLSTHLGQVPQH